MDQQQAIGRSPVPPAGNAHEYLAAGQPEAPKASARERLSELHNRLLCQRESLMVLNARLGTMAMPQDQPQQQAGATELPTVQELLERIEATTAEVESLAQTLVDHV